MDTGGKKGRKGGTVTPRKVHFGDVLHSQSLGLVQKNENKHNKSKHASVTKYTTT